MTTLYLDFETTSKANLKATGTHTYAEHPSTKVLCLSWAIDDGPVQTWWPGQPPPDLSAVDDPDLRVVAHNFSFDKAIWDRFCVEWSQLPLELWSCTAFRARLERLPADLDGVTAALKLPHRKDAAGKRLLRKIIKRNLDEDPLNPAETARLGEYCAGDVEALRAADQALPEIPDPWRPLFELDYEMNLRGMPVDLPTVGSLSLARDTENASLLARFRDLTRGALTPSQVGKLRTHLEGLGVTLPNLRRETIEKWQLDNLDRHDAVAELIAIRHQYAHSADSKLRRMLQAGSSSGRIRDAYVLHGAHTGRWAGRGVQLQNLRKAELHDPSAVLEALCTRASRPPRPTDFPLPVPVKEAIGNVLRGCFKAPPGWVFVSADLNQIEARVLCWLANQDNKLGQFRNNENVYLLTAQGVGSDNRDLGKLLDLSSGFGASARVILERAPGFGVPLTADEANKYTDAWRKKNDAIVRFWFLLFDRLAKVTELPPNRPPVEFNRFLIWRTEKMLYLQLPSGRCLKYHDPKLGMSSRAALELKVRLPKGGKLGYVSIWHGSATENVVQAIAYDVLVEAMLQLHRDGVFLVGTVHDEIVALAPVDEAAAVRARMLEVLQTPPEWAEGLPLAAEAYINQRYLKPTKGGGHAVLAPSAAERWINCPGSVAAIRLTPPPKVDSEAAAAGTEAHRVMAECLELDVPVAEVTKDAEMIDMLRHALMLARNIIGGRAYYVEYRLAAPSEWPQLWGTVDIIVFRDDGTVADIIDFKFGAGVVVEPDSMQLKIYALLAAQEFGCTDDGVTLHVIQPRREHQDGMHRKCVFSLPEMYLVADQVGVAITATQDPDAPRRPGSWCRFCIAAGRCPEYLAKSSSETNIGSAVTQNPFLPARRRNVDDPPTDGPSSISG